MLRVNINKNFSDIDSLFKTITKRKQKALDTKNKILTMAIELIKEKGYDNVTIDEISQKCGVTKGAFYHHFDSKESIIGSIYINSDAEILKKLPQIMEKSSTLEQMLEIALIYAETAQYRGVDITKQFFRNNLKAEGTVDTFDPEHFDASDPENRESVRVQIEILKKGQENGEIRKDMTCANILSHIFASYNGFLIGWCYKNGNYDFKEKVQKELPIVLSNFKASNEEKKL